MTATKSTNSSRLKLPVVIVIIGLLAIVLLGAVLLLPQLLSSSPQAANPVTARYANTSPETYYLTCIDSAFYDDGAIWRSCSFEVPSEVATEAVPAVNAMVRYDLETGAVDINWLFPDLDVTTRTAALLKLPDGDFVTVRGDNSARYVYRLRQAGGVEPLYIPPDPTVIENLKGVAIVGETVQMILTDGNNAVMLRTIPLDGSASTTTTVAGDFACGDETARCRLEFAYYGDATWRFVALRTPSAVAAGETPEMLSAEILTFTATGENPPTLTDTIELVNGLHYVVGDDGTVVPDSELLDVSAGNLARNFIRRAHPFVPEQSPDGAWQLLPLPDGVESAAIGSINSHYLLDETGLTWLPYFDIDDTGIAFYHWLGDQWLQVIRSSDGLRIAPIAEDAASRPVLIAETSLSSFAAGTQVLLPRLTGGYWYLDSGERYIQLDETLLRVE